MRQVQMIDDLIGSTSTIYSGFGYNDIEIYHTIPYFIGTWTDGEHEEIFYCSGSLNNNFYAWKDNSITYIKMDQVQYISIDDMYLEKAAFDGHIRASQYLINIQKVANRAIKDCDDMRKLGKCKESQYLYIYNNLHKLISKCQQVLRMHKEILASKGKSVVGFAVTTNQISKNSQLERVMRAIRILKKINKIE
tara:strand:- start:1960 stop:2538 length:579 start_codon:yes stop_codon:yes gene_type:complete